VQHTQLAGELPIARDGRCGLVLSASKELEPGSRAMLLLAEDLFRIDVVVSPDTIRTVIRNLSAGELTIEHDPGYGLPTAFASLEAATYRPGSALLRFSVGKRRDRIGVDVRIATLRFERRGTVRVTAQAIVRQAAAG
jgi:hypothetical protein